jgi:DNA-binding PadR family transcriptional regulator
MGQFLDDLGMGQFGEWFGDPRARRARRAKRGDVRAAALALIAEEPRNGYQIIQEISDRSEGVWRPSPGAVYPALAQLEDEGLIEATAQDSGRRQYRLTDKGQQYVTSHPEEVEAPWDVMVRSVGSDAVEMRRLFRDVVLAAVQVARVGTDAQVEQARQALSDTRRRLYRILAADEGEE